MLDPNFYINTPRLIISYVYPEKQHIMDFLIKLYNPEDDPTVPAYMSWKKGTGHEALYKIISDGNENIEKRGYGRHLVSVKSDSDSDSGDFHSDNPKYSPEDIAKFTPIGIVTMSLKRQPNGPNAPDVGFTFLKSFQGKGYAAEAVLALMEYYTESKGHTAFFGFTDETNVGANKLFARLGFEKRGVRNVKGIMYSGEDIISAIWSKGAAKELEEYGI